MRPDETCSRTAPTAAAWTRVALKAAMTWIAAALSASLLLGVDWLAVGDFDYRAALWYHAVMIPLLVMFCLLVVETLEVARLRSRVYGAAAMAAVALTGPVGLATRGEGLSAAAILRIVGMMLTDVLGVALLVSLLRVAWRRESRIGAPFWLVVASLSAVLLAAPLGHLAGWGVDVGLDSFPGAVAWTHVRGMNLESFQEGLVGAHSHLIVAATLSGLVALAAVMLGYDSAQGWRRAVSRTGAWLALTAVAGAALVYLISALAGWEPPAMFVSGPRGENGMPLDDVILAAAGLGWLLLIVSLAATSPGDDHAVQPLVRLGVAVNVVFGFVAAVGLGVYIEFHEAFYGGGASPAPGAANDLAYIRAHLVYAFMLLPVVLACLLAQPQSGRRWWSQVCAAAAVVGMTLGLAGELVWVGDLHGFLFYISILVLDAALVAGVVGAWQPSRAPGTAGEG